MSPKIAGLYLSSRYFLVLSRVSGKSAGVFGNLWRLGFGVNLEWADVSLWPRLYRRARFGWEADWLGVAVVLDWMGGGSR